MVAGEIEIPLIGKSKILKGLTTEQAKIFK